MCRECVSLELSVLDDDSILEHQVQEIDAIFSPNGGFTSQLLVWFPTRLDHSMACVHWYMVTFSSHHFVELELGSSGKLETVQWCGSYDHQGSAKLGIRGQKRKEKVTEYVMLQMGESYCMSSLPALKVPTTVKLFASRLSAWILSRIMGASVGFRVGRWKCLIDVIVKFKKVLILHSCQGAVESVSVGEIRVRLRQSLVKLGVGFISKAPKLQVLICDLEVVMRPSGKSTQKSRSRRSRSSGRGKWMVVANMARFLSVSINELVVKMPRATIEVKELRVDISKDGGSKPTLFVKLYLLPIVVHLGDPRVSYGQLSNFNHGGYTSTSHVSSALMEKTSAPFYCEELTLSSEFWVRKNNFKNDFNNLLFKWNGIGVEVYTLKREISILNATNSFLTIVLLAEALEYILTRKEVGVVIKNVDITSGEVTLNLNEELFLKTKGSSDAFSHAAEVVESSVESSPAKKPQKKQATLLSVTKYASIIPEKHQGKNPQLPSIVSLLTQGIGHPKLNVHHLLKFSSSDFYYPLPFASFFFLMVLQGASPREDFAFSICFEQNYLPVSQTSSKFSPRRRNSRNLSYSAVEGNKGEMLSCGTMMQCSIYIIGKHIRHSIIKVFPMVGLYKEDCTYVEPLINGDTPFPRDAETFVKILQSMVLKTALPVWTHPQFTDCSYDFIATVVSIIQHIYSGVEVKNISSNSGPRTAGPPPNESTIATIVEMGFSRSRAEEALRQVLSAPYLPSTPTPKMQLDHTPFEAKAYVSCQFHVLPELLAAMVQISGPPSRPLHPNSRDSSPLVEQ
ncbi:hypothetical protein TEA_015407 [Camellia sinensis var. sinensis]|uniref:UBA domain-containing protein n=1 Tax=Camellia sinensis var. sinensis TaxID=542762 RepID=A0A4S4F2L3_CAMSN|nr:hypothetical protein TEA_015407 [Camellia sinensis var. sinensis]